MIENPYQRPELGLQFGPSLCGLCPKVIMSYKRKAGKRFPALPAQGWQGLLWEGYRAQGADPRGEYRAVG